MYKLCFKTLVNKLIVKHSQITTVQKKALMLTLPYLVDVSLQTQT